MNTPILVHDLELTEPIRDLDFPARDDGLVYQGARLLVRMQGMPVGYVSLAKDALEAPSVAQEVWRQVSVVVNRRRTEHGLPALSALPVSGIPVEDALAEPIRSRPLVSVVLCTRDRPESLLVTLRGLAKLRYRAFEVVVVDNAPSSDLTRRAVQAEFGDDPRIRYVREPRPGLSRARNRGVAEAVADIIAFTDDDVRVDQWWLDGVVRGFGQADDVACVTGLVRTAVLDNVAELYFDQRQAWGASCERRIFDLVEYRDDSPIYPYSAGVFGAGANFAISKAALSELGGFDEALGAGTPSGGGEDLVAFVGVILAGHRLVYEPSAIVSHVHRAELGALSKQMRNYGSGCTAALTALMLRNRRARLELPSKVVVGITRVAAVGDRTKDDPALPSGLLRRERVGMMLGPWLYLRARRSVRRSAKQIPRTRAVGGIDAQLQPSGPLTLQKAQSADL
jgi:GT2 family glycosyltransferase